MSESENIKCTNGPEEDDEDNVITLDEFIEEEQRLETDANALLGSSDDKNCTYSLGYVKRQPLYACRTCQVESFKPGGVCLACSYHCHEGHDLVELYTKRNFRCDCGNSQFQKTVCNLLPDKDADNLGNSYNQNFKGTYCSCNRPYPDPDDSTPDEMIQCIVCEDWYHTRHLHNEVPPEDGYAEMICKDCTEKLPFLQYYAGYAVTKIEKEKQTSNLVNGDSSEKTLNGSVKSPNKVANLNVESKSKIIEIEGKAFENSAKTADIDIQGADGKLVDTSENCKQNLSGCLLKSMSPISSIKNGATFWPHNFRTLLCSCEGCKELYKQSGVEWILDLSDTVQAYEDKGRNKESDTSFNSKNSMENVLSVLSRVGMDRFSQAEAILNYNELKSHLTEYLAKFAENKKVVREEDIREFFSQMNARKRQKIDQPYMCR